MADQTNPLAAFASLSLSLLEDTLGVLFIGYVFASVGFGFTFFQSYFYYTQYSKDHWLTKATVVALCTLDTVMSCLSSQMLYYYLVTLFTQPVIPEQATPSFCVEVLLSGVAVAIVQCFYAVRVWQVSRNVIIATIIVVIAIAGAGLGIATGVVMLHNPTFANFSQHYMMVVISTGQGLRLLAGGLDTAAVIVYGAKPARNNDDEPSLLWDSSTTFLSNGTAGVIAQFLCFVTFVAAPKKYVWIIFHLLSSRVIINGLLLMLNSRTQSRGRGMYGEDTRVSRGRAAGISPGTTVNSRTRTNVSEIVFNPSATKTFDTEVSREVKTDSDAKHQKGDEMDLYSFNSQKPVNL